MQLEHEAGVIVEAAAEGGREPDASDVDPARGEKAGAALEQVERGIERDLGVAGKGAQLGRGCVGIAADGEEFLDQRAGLPRQRGLRAERRLLEKAVGDLADRAPADRGDAGDREQVGDQRMCRFRVGAGERGEHALVFRPRPRGADGEPIEILRQRGLVVEVLDQPPLPGRREIERGDQRGKQADVADADVGCGKPVMRGGVEPEREHFGVRRRGVAAAEGFDAGLQEFARAFAMAKDRAEIAEALRLAGRGRGEIVARDRDGEVGPQAQFVALRVGGQIHALADVLAGKVEERLRRLQDRRCDPRIAGALERGQQCVGPHIEGGARRDRGCTRHGAVGQARLSLWRGDLARFGGDFDAKAVTRLTLFLRLGRAVRR